MIPNNGNRTIQKIKETIDIVFPWGNWRYYLWYLSFCLVYSWFQWASDIVMNMIITGITAETDVLIIVVHSPYEFGTWLLVMGWGLSLAGIFTIILFLFTCCSIIIDTCRGIYRGYKWIKLRINKKRN